MKLLDTLNVLGRIATALEDANALTRQIHNIVSVEDLIGPVPEDEMPSVTYMDDALAAELEEADNRERRLS
jgi:hypothetical protein